MAIATRWRGFGGSGGSGALPLLLLVSLLLHLLVIAWPVGGRSVGTRAAGDFRPLLLHAALNPTSAASAPAIRQSAPVVDAAPEFAVAPRAVPPADGGAAQRRSGQKFYPSAALTRKPVALEEPELEDGDAVVGELLLTLWIDERGTVVALADERGDLPSDRRRAVADAFRRLRFAPGEINGAKVATVMRIEVNYADEPLPITP